MSLLFLILVIFHVARLENIKRVTKVLLVSGLTIGTVLQIVSHIYNAITKNDWSGPITELCSTTITLLILLVSPIFYRWLAKKFQPNSATTASTSLSPATQKRKTHGNEIFIIISCVIPFWFCQFMVGMLHSVHISTIILDVSEMGSILIVALFAWFFYHDTPKRYLVSAAAVYCGWCVWTCVQAVLFGISSHPVGASLTIGLSILFILPAVVWLMRKPHVGVVIYLIGIQGFYNLLIALHLKFSDYTISSSMLMIIVLIALTKFIVTSVFPIVGFINYKKAIQSNT